MQKLFTFFLCFVNSGAFLSPVLVDQPNFIFLLFFDDDKTNSMKPFIHQCFRGLKNLSSSSTFIYHHR